KRLLTQLDRGDVPDAHDCGGLISLSRLERLTGLVCRWLGLDDDVLELRDVRKPAHHLNGELGELIRGDRWSAELSRCYLNILVLDCALNLENGETVGFQFKGIEPDAHAVRPGAKNLHLPDTR